MIWITPKQAAETTGLKVETIRYKLRRGQLPARRRNGRWYIMAYRGSGLPYSHAPDGRVLSGSHCPVCGIEVGYPTFLYWKYDGRYWRHKCMPLGGAE